MVNLGTRLLKILHKIFGDKGLWSIPFVPILYESYYQLISNEDYKTITVKEMDFTVFSNDSGVSKHLIMYNTYEDNELSLFQKTISKGDVIVDAGANIGLYTLVAAKILNNTGEVHSFEPDPNNFSLLKRNVDQNDFQNVFLNRLALVEKRSKKRLHLSKYSRGSHSLFESNVPIKNGSIEILTTSLDSYFDNIDKKEISVLKVDVQGSEPMLIEGAKELLSNGKIRNIFIEHFADGLPKNFNMVKTLEYYGYNIFVIDPNNKVEECLIKVNSTTMDMSMNCDLFCTLDNYHY